MTASVNNGRRNGGGMSSPPGLEQVAELTAGIRPHDLPDDEKLPPATRKLLSELEWPTPVHKADGGMGMDVGSNGRKAAEARGANPLTWPTPDQWMDSPSANKKANRKNLDGNNTLAIAVEWATATSHPRTHDPRAVDHGEQLANQADQWMTPFGMGNIDQTGKRGGGGEFAKAVEGWIGWTPDAEAWPTPDGQVFQDGMNCTLEEWEERRRRLKADAETPNGNGCGTPLAMAANLWESTATAWPSPSARDPKGRDLPRRPGSGASLPHFVETGERTHSSLPAPVTATAGEASSPSTPRSPRPRLSPIFVAWLMGWPMTALGICDCSGTGLSPCKRPMRSCGCGECWFRRMRGELERLCA